MQTNGVNFSFHTQLNNPIEIEIIIVKVREGM
jgi:hypothetical protein